MVVLMTGFNSCTHGSQDLYLTFSKSHLSVSLTDVTVSAVVNQMSCVIGGVVIGYISTFFGRLLTIICNCAIRGGGGALLPSYIPLRPMTLVSSAIVEQFFVVAVWGPFPIHLQALASSSLRALMVGLTYQLRNMASSVSATIAAAIGERLPLPPAEDGAKRYDYEKVIGILMSSIWVVISYSGCFSALRYIRKREESGLKRYYMWRKWAKNIRTLLPLGRKRL